MHSVNDNAISTETRRKKLRFRAWHRGMKEMDIILGNFADRHLAQFSTAELDLFETLLHIPDQPLYAMVVGDQEIPSHIDGPMFRAVLDFSKHLPASHKSEKP